MLFSVRFSLVRAIFQAQARWRAALPSLQPLKNNVAAPSLWGHFSASWQAWNSAAHATRFANSFDCCLSYISHCHSTGSSKVSKPQSVATCKQAVSERLGDPSLDQRLHDPLQKICGYPAVGGVLSLKDASAASQSVGFAPLFLEEDSSPWICRPQCPCTCNSRIRFHSSNHWTNIHSITTNTAASFAVWTVSG